MHYHIYSSYNLHAAGIINPVLKMRKQIQRWNNLSKFTSLVSPDNPRNRHQEDRIKCAIILLGKMPGRADRHDASLTMSKGGKEGWAAVPWNSIQSEEGSARPSRSSRANTGHQESFMPPMPTSYLLHVQLLTGSSP